MRFLSVTESIKDIIVQEGSADMIWQAACNEGMVTLRENAIKKMLDGDTAYREVIRITWGQI